MGIALCDSAAPTCTYQRTLSRFISQRGLFFHQLFSLFLIKGQPFETFETFEKHMCIPFSVPNWHCRCGHTGMTPAESKRWIRNRKSNTDSVLPSSNVVQVSLIDEIRCLLQRKMFDFRSAKRLLNSAISLVISLFLSGSLCLSPRFSPPNKIRRLQVRRLLLD